MYRPFFLNKINKKIVYGTAGNACEINIKCSQTNGQNQAQNCF